MSQENPSGIKTFTSGESIMYYQLGTLASGKVNVCSATDKPLGSCTFRVDEADQHVAIRLLPGLGTRKLVAAGAISEYADVHTAANGRVSSTAATGSYRVGTALEAATAAGDVIEVLTDYPITPAS